MGKNASTEDLEKMGLVEGPPGTWSQPKPDLGPKMAAKVQKIQEKKARSQANPKEVVIDDPPTFRKLDGTKYYLTANVFFASYHWKVRKHITTWTKNYLKPRMRHLKPLAAHSTLLVVFSVKREITPKMNFDVDNRGYFWGKMFQDQLEKMELVPNDNAYWISKVHYEFDYELKEDKITFRIL